MEAQLKRLVVAVILIDGVATACSGQEAQPVKLDTVKKFDIPVAGGPMMATCRINGQEVRLVVDTYSALTSVTRAAARKLGLKSKSTVVTIGSISEPLEICEGLEIEVGSVRVVPRNGVRVSDRMSDAIGPIKRDGSLGMDILREFALRMDLGAESASLVRSLAEAPIGDCQRMPLSFNILGHPMVVISTGQGQMVECVVDSSALAPIGFSREPFDVLVERRDITKLPYQARIATASQTTDTQLGVLGSCRFGELEIIEPKVFRIDRNFIGLWTLARFNAVIDFPAKALYLKKGPYFGAVDTSDRYGIEVKPVTGGMRVNQVIEGTLLWKLGLRQGDEILTVGGHNADQHDGWLASQAIGYFRAAPIELRIKRLNGEFTMELPASERSSITKP